MELGLRFRARSLPWRCTAVVVPWALQTYLTTGVRILGFCRAMRFWGVAATSLSASVPFSEDENHAIGLFRRAVRILNNMESVVLSEM